jgi:uncharacterized protein YneF (UPF0154 family)
MEIIREQLEKPLVTGILGVVVGLLLGLLWGYVVAPTQWIDQPLDWVRADLREDYLRMAIDSYKYNPDETLARKRWEDLGSGAGDVLAIVQGAPQQQGAEAVNKFSQLVGVQPAAQEGEVAETPADEGKGSSITVLLVMCLITIILGGALVGYFLFRRGRPEGTSPAAQAQEFTNQMERTDFGARDGIPPMSQFMTTYMVGDDLFDDSFSIDSPTGEFLGECGVGISDSIGVGEPKKVTAFEVWLFDKNDIQTVTRVLMSQHAFQDDGLRARLAAKGEPFLVELGSETVLETATLRLIARVVDMAYGSGATPASSFFDRVTLELAIWKKDE